jgi:acyl-CoA dehydrogenase
VAIAEAVLRFVEREVLPLQQRHHDLLGSERTLFDASGRYVPEALALRQQVRKRSAELGFYTLFGDETLGGGGQGAQVMAHVQEVLNHHVVRPSRWCRRWCCHRPSPTVCRRCCGT